MVVWEKKESSPVTHVAIAGDFLPASGLQLPPRRSWRDIAAGLTRPFSKADVAILNLECCIDVGDSKPRTKFGLGDSFAAEPDVLDFPVSLGANLIGMANNHIYDYGEEGLARTRQAVQKRALVPVGIGKTLSEPPDATVAQTGAGPRIGVWAAARHLPELATRKKPGIEPATRKRGEEALRELKAKDASLTIAYLHAGLEHTNRPDPDDVALLRELAKIGFDIVTACHSHRIAGYERVRRADGTSAFCFYGLGSISSGVLYSELEREGLVVVAGLDASGEIVRLTVHPVHLEATGWGRTPRFADAYNILNRFELLSEELTRGTYKERFYNDTKIRMLHRQLRDLQAAVQNGGVRGLASKLRRVRMRHLNRALHGMG
ncbi:MAG TPA: CapA family protein [Candidatus Sulfotelmatobacter sp.]|nr:CapA family protein [Candidatus Sulfotelmatobacter sp.]